MQVDEQRLYEIARNARPEVKAALLQIERDEKSVQPARRQYWPDVTLGASWGNTFARRDEPGRMNPPPGDGKDVYSVTVGVNIPVFRSKHDAGVQEASERFTASREAYRGVVNQVEMSVRSIGFQLRTIDEQIALSERALLPQAEQSLISSEAAYAGDEAGVLDLLDSERMLLLVALGTPVVLAGGLYSMTPIPVDASLRHRPYPRSLGLGVIARRFRHRRTR